MAETLLLLVRHAESARDPNIPEPDWPLSDQGAEQASRLADDLSAHRPSGIYASPFARAVATVEPLSEATRLAISLEQDLRERKLSDGRRKDWKDLVARSWQDFDFSLPDGESFRDCQMRMNRCLQRIAMAHSGQTIVACSHGNAISLFLNGIDAGFGHDGWHRMKNPDVFAVRWRNDNWVWPGPA